MPTHALFHRGAEVLPQMKTVSDLDGLRGSDASAFSVGARTISADHLDSRMLTQPCGQGPGVPSWQQAKRLAVSQSMSTVP